MKTFKLREKFFITIDDDFEELLLKYKWNVGTSGYLQRGGRRIFNGKTLYKQIYFHHEILPRLDGFVIDHINRNKLDNRKCNLRYATYSQNNKNKEPILGITGYRGVTKARGKFNASIRTNGKRIHIGNFDTAEEAAKAYTIATAKHSF